MGSRTAYLYEDEDLMRLANQIKGITVKQLVDEGLLDPEDAKKFDATQFVVVAKKGLLGEGIDRVLGWLDGDRDKDDKTFMFASIESKRKPEEG